VYQRHPRFPGEAGVVPRATGPVERVARRVTARANEPRPDPALLPTDGWHRPLAQNDLDLVRLDHDPLAGPGNPCERGVGPLPLPAAILFRLALHRWRCRVRA
jgi:hypothetical protein